MIYCCGKFQKPVKSVCLLSDFNYTNRRLDIIVCDVCGKITAELSQYNVKTKKFKIRKLQKRQLNRFLINLKNGSWQEVKLNYGTKSASGFNFGVNKQDKKGNIYQYSVDFNGVKKLIKIINN